LAGPGCRPPQGRASRDRGLAAPPDTSGPGEFSDDMYAAQADWEHEWLASAARRGVIMFWLAKEAVHDCGRAYAQTTRFELGEAVALHYASERRGERLVRAVVGIEDGYTGARYVRRTVSKKRPRRYRF